MKDILDREINIGDIIVYGKTFRSRFGSYTASTLGVISKITPGGNTYVIKDRTSGTPILQSDGSPYTCISIPKVVFYPLNHDDHKNLLTGDKYKNGKPKYKRILMTTSCIKISTTDLNEEYRKSYDVLIKELRIC